MIPELIAGTVERIPQDLSQRTYFGLSNKPENNCLVSFEWPAAQIDAFCRALDFEDSHNPIGRPKIVLGGNALIVRQVKLTGVRSLLPPGTITAIAPELRVATATEDIVFPTVETTAGRPLSPGELLNYGCSE
jgi:methionyl-tRNA formyltransferase